MRFIYAVKSSSNNHFTPKEVYETVKQQYMSLLVPHHPISGATRVSEIWYFAWNLRFVIGRNGIVLTINSLYMLSKALPIITIPLRIVRKDSASIDTSPCSIQSHFMHWEGTQYLEFCMKFEICYWQKWHGVAVWTIRCSYMLLPEALPIILIQLRIGIYNSQVSMYVPHYSTSSHFLCREGARNWYFAWKLRLVFSRNDKVYTLRDL